MVNREVFSPAAVPEPERHALRSKLCFGRPESFLLVYAGRVSAEKGLDFCVQLLRESRYARNASLQPLAKSRFEAITKPAGDHRQRGVVLAIIGAGPQEEDFAALHGQPLTAGGGSNRVYCVPKFVSQAEVAAAYCAADAYFSGSEFETLGFGAIEAMSCGAPALCPAAQGFRDTVQHGVTGYLYTPRSVEHADECLGKLREGREIDAAAMLAAGESMTIAGCAARAREVYADAAEANRTRPCAAGPDPSAGIPARPQG